MGAKELGCGDWDCINVVWINVVWIKGQWLAVVSKIMNFYVPHKATNVLTK